MKKAALAVMIMLIISLYLPVMAVSAESRTYDGVINRIYALKDKFPHGMNLIPPTRSVCSVIRCSRRDIPFPEAGI